MHSAEVGLHWGDIMAAVDAYGYLRTNTNDQIPLAATSANGGQLTEGSVGTMQTDATLTGTVQQIGNYKPGATIVSGEIFGPNNGGFAFILRQGLVLAWLIPNKTGVTNRECMLSSPVTLRPGDLLRVQLETATSRNVALMVKTSNNISRIFTGTMNSTDKISLVDSQDATSIGDTLQGTVLTHAVFVAPNTGKVFSSQGGAIIQNASGQLAGAIPASDPRAVEPMVSMVNIPIELNWTASATSVA